jgi:hypothetical protein
MLRRVRLAGLCLALGLGVAGVAAAQEGSSRLTRLHDDLHLSAAQETGWHFYAAAVTPDPVTRARHQAAEKMMASLPTPRRVALIEATMSQDLDDFRRQGAAVKTFYAGLTPEQQKTFDRETVPSAPPPQSSE